MSVLVTGGLGYIGSHTCVKLLEKYDIIIIDNLDNSNIDVLNKIEKITNCTDNNTNKIKFYKIDILNKSDLEKVFQDNNIQSVIHFAALKAVNESIKNPLKYYTNNITGTLNLLEIMQKYNCYHIIFSSSATVYGNNNSPLDELMKTGNGITNPYGQTKFMIEQILMDLAKSNQKFHIIALRYFNPIGAHKSGLIGESPNGIPNNLMPYILRVGINNNTETKLNECYNELKIFGNDYHTYDGTCVRDYIHVVDLADGHIMALERINNFDGFNAINLGTGNGFSVLELVKTFQKINNVKIPYKIVERRDGDLPIIYCDPTKAKKLLNWETKLTIEDMCLDSWNFAVLNNN